MTDINASLKKTIDGEPGPQYKEKGKAEFNFIEGEEGVPYSYDKKVESRLTAIENKLDSVIENGSVNTQLTGSIVKDGIPVKKKNKVIVDEVMTAETIDPNRWSKEIDIGYTNETDVWFAINIDAEPWSLNTGIFTYDGNLLSMTTPKGYGVFPPKRNESTTYRNSNYPCTMLWMGGIYNHKAFGLEMPATLSDAYSSRTGYFPSRLSIENGSDQVATVTLKIIRIWK